MALITIAPTILTNDPNRYKTLVEAYHPFAKRAQIDISDGTLAAQRTVPLTSVWWPKNWLTDIHMMVTQPSLYLNALIKLRPHLVIFHSEVQENLLPVFEQLHHAGIKTGLAIMKPTYPGTVRNLIEAADHAMIFSGTLGVNGGTADLLQIEKIRIVKKIKREIEIGWDGGVNIGNIRTIAQGGATVIDVGSAIANDPNPADAYAKLSAEAEKQGVI